MGKNQPQSSNLPTAVFDHFGKAMGLHEYVLEHLGTAAQYAYQAGQELLAAKKLVPHGRWEEECAKHFAPSPRTAQVYMRLTKHVDLLPKAQRFRIFYVETTIEGATKEAKRLATKGEDSAPTPPPAPPAADNDADPFDEDTSPDAPETPEDASEDDGAVDTPEEPETPAKGKQTLPKQYDRSDWLKQWDNSIGPLVRLVDKIANNVGEAQSESHKTVHEHLNMATEEMMEWMKE